MTALDDDQVATTVLDVDKEVYLMEWARDVYYELLHAQEDALADVISAMPDDPDEIAALLAARNVTGDSGSYDRNALANYLTGEIQRQPTCRLIRVLTPSDSVIAVSDIAGIRFESSNTIRAFLSNLSEFKYPDLVVWSE
jgi:hypothetical protein